MSVYSESASSRNNRALAIPGERALDHDILLAVDAHTSSLVGQLHQFQVHEPREFAGRHCVSVGENLGK